MCLLPLDERLRLDDGVFVGERVERRDQQTPGPGFDGDEAERSDGQAVVGLEIVQQAAFQAIAQDFVVDVQENLRRQRLDLKAGLIVQARGQRQGGAVFAADAVLEFGPVIGQGQIGGGGHFGQVSGLGLPAQVRGRCG